MKSFKQFLIEMSLSDALKVFGLKSNYTSKELKLKYRQLSKENHPDKGGSTEAMKLVNVSYDLLKNTAVDTKDKVDQEKHNIMWNETARFVKNDLVMNLDLEKYKKYFETTFDEQFNITVNKIYPDDQDVVSKRSVYNAFYDVKFSNNDNTKVFELNISVYIASVVQQMSTKGIGSSKTTYPMGVSTFAYMDSRRVKITSRDYTHINKKSVFTKPETVFPKAKIYKKKKKTLFRKASMLASLKAELQADRSGDYYYLPTGDGNKYIGIYRVVMMRQGLWSINGIYEKNERGRYISDKGKSKFMSLPESEDTLDIFRKLKSLSANDGMKYIESEYKKLINK